MIHQDLAQWRDGICTRCETPGYVIVMHTGRKLCDTCFGRTGEKVGRKLIYVPGTEPLGYNKRESQ